LRIDAPTEKPARVDVAAQKIDVTATNDENIGKNGKTRLSILKLEYVSQLSESQVFATFPRNFWDKDS